MRVTIVEVLLCAKKGEGYTLLDEQGQETRFRQQTTPFCDRCYNRFFSFEAVFISHHGLLGLGNLLETK